MLFNSYDFAIFLVVVFTTYWAIAGRPRLRTAWLLAASYLFYGYWDWRFLGLILASTVLDYFVARALARTEAPRRRKGLLLLSLVGNLGGLGFFKYWGFFVEQAAALIEAIGLEPHLPTLQVLLPVGISFYTFQTLSYTIDVYRRQLEPEPSFLRFALFVTFFPQLVAGPIVRARDFLPQLRRRPVLTGAAFESGLALFFWGLTKKILIADYLGTALVDGVWEEPGAYGGLATLLGIYGYALQIYGDFSGYSDCAIGLARLLGFELCENFDAPYRALSPRDFWRRWHISLSTWLRDYLYIALGGNRGSAFLTYRNLVLTMLLGGLWHGASWMFVIWGAYHGLLLVADRLIDPPDPRGLAATWVRRVLMFQLTCLGWVLFRSATTADAGELLASLAAPRGDAVIGTWVYAALVFGFATHLLPERAKDGVRDGFLGLAPFARGALYALWLALLVAAHQVERPFIYFQF
ncbi:MAG TPA: MBOAT family protein [Planctomycetota bacterium]|nr:MBOAT family protein [Planctomycetota bacterium]